MSEQSYSEQVTRDILSIKRQNGIAGIIAVTVKVRSHFPDAPDSDSVTTFVGSVYGDSVVMIMEGGHQVFVRDADRFGNFATDPNGWVRAFNA